MVVGGRQLLLDLGVEKRKIHAELFFVGDVRHRLRRAPRLPPTRRRARSRSCSTDAARRSTWRPDGGSVLDAVLRERSDAPFACKGGVCGTCRAKIVEGEVEMTQNWALEDEEVERGYVLTCQSHPRTAKVVLDYDA